MRAVKIVSWTTAALGVALLATIIVWGLDGAKPADWWAAWGQWVGGLGSIAAAGAAVWIAVEGWRRSERHQAEQQAQEQASKFAVWIDKIEIESPIPPLSPSTIRVRSALDMPISPATTRTVDVYALMFQNSSALPVYDVAVSVELIGHITFLSGASACGPGPSPQQLDDDDRPSFHGRLRKLVRTVLPEANDEDTRQLTEWEEALGDALADSGDPVKTLASNSTVTVRFRDANGLGWRRHANGRLERFL